MSPLLLEYVPQQRDDAVCSLESAPMNPCRKPPSTPGTMHKLPTQEDAAEIAAQVAPRLRLAGCERMETMRPDHPERMERALLALMGLSVGDAFGECFFGPAQVLQLARSVRTLPPSPWYYTCLLYTSRCV